MFQECLETGIIILRPSEHGDQVGLEAFAVLKHPYLMWIIPAAFKEYMSVCVDCADANNKNKERNTRTHTHTHTHLTNNI